jgi:hypothetical protein
MLLLVIWYILHVLGICGQSTVYLAAACLLVQTDCSKNEPTHQGMMLLHAIPCP